MANKCKCKLYLQCCCSSYSCITRVVLLFCRVGLYSEYGYDNRLTMLENEFPGSNVLLHKLGRLPQASFLQTKLLQFNEVLALQIYTVCQKKTGPFFISA